MKKMIILGGLAAVIGLGIYFGGSKAVNKELELEISKVLKQEKFQSFDSVLCSVSDNTCSVKNLVFPLDQNNPESFKIKKLTLTGITDYYKLKTFYEDKNASLNNLDIEWEAKGIQINNEPLLFSKSKGRSDLTPLVKNAINKDFTISGGLKVRSTESAASFSLGLTTALEDTLVFDSTIKFAYNGDIKDLKNIDQNPNALNLLTEVSIEKLKFSIENKRSFIISSVYDIYLKDISDNKNINKYILNTNEKIGVSSDIVLSKVEFKNAVVEKLRAELNNDNLTKMKIKVDKNSIVNFIDKDNAILTLSIDNDKKVSIMRLIQMAQMGDINSITESLAIELK